MAKQNNPSLELALDYPQEDVTAPTPVASALVLRVGTERGAVEYERRPGESWYDVFRRAGLLRR